jgi:hypothetical protein
MLDNTYPNRHHYHSQLSDRLFFAGAKLNSTVEFHHHMEEVQL